MFKKTSLFPRDGFPKTLVIKVISVIAIHFCSVLFRISKLDMRIESKNSLLEVQQLRVGVLLQGWGLGVMVIECCFVDLWGVVVPMIFSKDKKRLKH